jgi:hypothetical protein
MLTVAGDALVGPSAAHTPSHPLVHLGVVAGCPAARSCSEPRRRLRYEEGRAPELMLMIE